MLTLIICIVLTAAVVLLAPITSRIACWILDHTIGQGSLGDLFDATIGRWWDFLDRKLDGR